MCSMHKECSLAVERNPMKTFVAVVNYIYYFSNMTFVKRNRKEKINKISDILGVC